MKNTKNTVMKKTMLPALVMLMALASCKKDQKELRVIKNETRTVTIIDSNGVKRTDSTVVFMRENNGKKGSAEQEVRKYEYTYMAFDGTTAAVTFTHYPDKSFLLIERNMFKIELPQTKVNEKEAVFEKEGIKALVTGNRITLTQGGKTVELQRK